MDTVKTNEDELGERLRVLLERSSYIVNEEIYVKAYSRDSIDNGKGGRGRFETSEYYQFEKDFTDTVSDILSRSGISHKHKGFRYIVECCSLIGLYSIFDYMITKDVYPEVARNFNTSTACVEHAIRTCINAGWDTRSMVPLIDATLWNRFRYKPTNKDFIDALFCLAISKLNTDK